MLHVRKTAALFFPNGDRKSVEGQFFNGLASFGLTEIGYANRPGCITYILYTLTIVVIPYRQEKQYAL